MMWSVILVAVSLAAASLPSASSDVDDLPILCTQLNDTDREVIGITSYSKTVAVASRFTVSLHSVGAGTKPCRFMEEFPLVSNVDKFLEFRLLDDKSFVYCDISKCFFCKRKGPSKWPCLELDVRSSRRDDGEITMAASTKMSRRRLALRVIFQSKRASFYTFNEESDALLDDNIIYPLQTATDVPYFSKHFVGTGFNAKGYTYFVTSSYQPYEPFVNAKLKAIPRYIAKVVRICDDDKTPSLESRIDIAVMCPMIDYLSFREVATAVYDKESERVFIHFASTADDVVCSFTVNELNLRFDYTWDLCQNTTYNDAISDCEYIADFGKVPAHCYIFTRMGDGNRMLSCSRFSANMDLPKFANCELDKYTSTAYRYGWIENYKPIIGKLVARILNGRRRFKSIMLHESTDSLFISTDDAILRIPADLHKEADNSTAVSQTMLHPIWPSTRFPITSIDDSAFFYVLMLKVSCPGLFPTCEDLKNGGFKDHLQCVYCPNGNGGGRSIAIKDKTSCDRVLYKTCPPVLEHAYQNPATLNEWLLTGKGLRNLDHPKVRVCNQSCEIDHGNHVDEKLSCTLPSATVLDASCGVTLQGQLESFPNFLVRPTRSMVDASSQTDKNSSSSMNKSTKVLIGVAVVLLIIGVLVVIILGARKYLGMRNQKSDGSMGVPFDTFNSHPRNAVRNTYLSTNPTMPPFAYVEYERLFKSIDDRLKIPSDQLILEKEIGKGHFGVVFKGVYEDDDGERHSVACKTLTGNLGSIGEFLSEGLMMDKFKHERVMHLLGISFAEDHVPIIVTEFMENGDLAKYLRNEKNKPTLRNLLIFAVEIAEGMLYLHKNNFIHRDLAARNCMLDAKLNIKIADFGLCREASHMGEYEPLHRGRELPLRWMAIEALEHEQFTMPGDVWAYGVVLWEIMTRGLTPYQNIQSINILGFLKMGRRLGNPDFCPEMLYELMTDCWREDPNERPTFEEIPDRIQEIILFLENQGRKTMLNSEYEQSNSARNSNSTSVTTASTPLSQLSTVSHVHALPIALQPNATPV